ncbi:MAG: matrixin family metalloprotease, partial [Gemmatimonadales bacterium]
QWTSIPGVALRFQEAAGRGTAQVIVKWVTQMSTEHSGLTAWETDQNGWIASAVMTLTLLRRDGQPVDRHLARRIALHEVGHLIGLGHSEDAGDMMFPTSEQSRLSSRDRSTAKLLYAVEPWVLLEPGP